MIGNDAIDKLFQRAIKYLGTTLIERTVLRFEGEAVTCIDDPVAEETRIIVSATGGAANVGDGEGKLFAGKDEADIEIKSIKAGDGIGVSNETERVVITNTVLPAGSGTKLQYRAGATAFGATDGADYDSATDRVRFLNPYVLRNAGNDAIVRCLATAARTIDVPDATTMLVGRDTVDELTNKTIDLAANVVTDDGASTDDAFVFDGSVMVARKIRDANVDANYPIGRTKLVADPSINGLRLTLTSGAPVPTSDVTSATTIYLTPFISGAIALYNGTDWILRTTGEISLALGALTSGKNYDVFARWTGIDVALELSAAWTSDTVRADALTRQDGVLVKDALGGTRRYLGTIRTISTTQTCDTSARRFVWNVDNRVERAMSIIDATSTWTYTVANTWRQARAQTSNRVECVSGAVTAVRARAVSHGYASVGGVAVSAGVGINSTTVNSAQIFGAVSAEAANSWASGWSDYVGALSGYLSINWLEITSYTNTTMVGQRAYAQAGLVASILG